MALTGLWTSLPKAVPEVTQYLKANVDPQNRSRTLPST